MTEELFGFEFRKRKELEKDLVSFVQKDKQDGAINLEPTFGAQTGLYVNLEGSLRTEVELVNAYRKMAEQAEVAIAINEICHDSITMNDKEEVIRINLDKVNASDSMKDKIKINFDQIIKLLEFNTKGFDIFKRWYIDGRLYFHVIVSKDRLKEGILELRYIDPRNIRKVREISKKKNNINNNARNNPPVYRTENEYYIYNEKGFGIGNKNTISTNQQVTGLKIALDSIIYVPSGLVDANGNVISYLSYALKWLNQLRSLEDAMIIYRIARAPERRIWYIDVGEMTPHKAEQYVQEVAKRHKTKLAYDPTTGCFTMDTKVPLLDGRTLSIEEIAKEYESGKQLWAYSCHPETGEIMPGKITWAGITRKEAQVMKITLDNGKEIICTPDHKFPVWNKGFMEAKDLSIGESMIPFYTSKLPFNKSYPTTYERFYDNKAKQWLFTHRMVAKWAKEYIGDNYITYKKLTENTDKKTVHHVDFDRFNNSPENLVFMNNEDHWNYHSDIIKDRLNDPNSNIVKGIRQFNEEFWTEENRKKHGDLVRERWKNGVYENVKCVNEKAWSNETNQERRIQVSNRYKVLYTKPILDIIETFAKHDRTTKETVEFINSCEDIMAEWIALNEVNQIKQFDRFMPNNRKFMRNNINLLLRDMGYTSWREYKYSLTNMKYIYKQASGYVVKKYDANNKEIYIGHFKSIDRAIEARDLHNHKIINIEYLEDKREVGTITIDGKEEYHNHHTFALDAGIFTKNSMVDAKRFSTILEDFYLPRRGVGGRGTEVETLPPGRMENGMEDVEYFLKKLYKSLFVPYSRLDSQDTYIFANQTTEISREEMNFSKFIDQLRLKFNNLFIQALEKHLILKNITTYEDWVNDYSPNTRFNYTEDIYFKELKETSIFSTRLNNLMIADPFIGKYLSRQWAMKKIMRFTDDEIEQMDKEIVDEQTNPLINDPGGFITPADQEDGSVRDYRDYRIPPVNRGYKRN